MKRYYNLGFCLVVLIFSANVFATVSQQTFRVDNNHVRTWNGFADEVYQLHEKLIADNDVRKETKTGGYHSYPDFYVETIYYDKDSGSVVSRIKRETSNRENLHVAEVYLRDKEDRVIVDYMFAYLPVHRNAPIQTLINLHNYNNELHAFRQFDASGDRIYEQCKGKLNGKEIFMSLEEHEFEEGKAILATVEYQQCFQQLPKKAGKLLSPLHAKN